MTTKIQMIDALQLQYLRRRRGASGGCIETRHTIGFAGEEEIRFNEATCKIYRSIHWSGENWHRVEYVLVGDGDWEIPKPPHPDCLVVREPRDGEIWDSETELLWLAPGRCVELTGTLAARIFEGKHGDVVGDAGEYMDQRVFEDCLDALTAEYGLEIDGPLWEYMVQALAKAVGDAKLIGADEEIVNEITARVHESVLGFVDGIAE